MAVMLAPVEGRWSFPRLAPQLPGHVVAGDRGGRGTTRSA